MREMPFSEVGTISNDPVEPRAVYGSNEMFDALSEAAIDTIVKLYDQQHIATVL